MAAPLAGSKKLLAAILPLEARLPCTRLTSTLLKLLSVHVALADHELPLSFWLLLRLTCAELVVLPLFFAAMLLVRVATAVLTLKPTSGLFQAVLRCRTKLPGWELSVKPFAALEKAMQFVTLWSAAFLSASSPPPSLKPLPSPAKSGKFQRLKPLPQAMVSTMVILDLNSLVQS